MLRLCCLLLLLLVFPRLVNVQSQPQPCNVPQRSVPLPQADTLDELREIAADYLSSGGDPQAFPTQSSPVQDIFPDRANTLATYADVTGNGFLDLVINIHADLPKGVDSQIWLLACAGTQYRLLNVIYNPDPLVFWRGMVVGGVGDLTGDGASEIVMDLMDCGAHTCFLSLKVFSYSSLLDGLFQLTYNVPVTDERQFFQDNFDLLSGSYYVETGVIYARQGLIGSAGAGPQRGADMTIEWQDWRFVVTNYELDPPEYRFQMTEDATTALNDGDYETAYALFSQAITDSSLLEVYPDNEQYRAMELSYATYGKLVAAVAHFGAGSLEARDAHMALTQLQLIAGYPRERQVDRNVWQEVGILFYTVARNDSPTEACKRIVTYIQENDLTDPVGFGYWPSYGYAAFIPTPNRICPF
jgi:hypothetical protein